MRQLIPLTLYLLINLPAMSQMDCRSVEYKKELLRNNPGLSLKIQEIEGFTRSYRESARIAVTGETGQAHGEKGAAFIAIPVVVHIVYNSAAENISDAQVRSQIDVLNADYGKLNADTAAIPSYYSFLSANCGFRFILANVDTNGAPTSGIIRKHTNVQHFDLGDHIKSSSQGGDDAWDRDQYLNIWVGNLTGGILGYSSVPGGPKNLDGVAILYTAFGTKGTAVAPFNLGRTATHEIGHWLNLIHVWGDTSCGDDDVDDTPQQQTASSGSPSGIRITCGNTPYGDMYMDFMDFTDDIGMHMFTYGQKERMQSLFADGGSRHALLSSKGLSSTAIVTGGTPSTFPLTDSARGDLSIYPNPAAGSVLVTIKGASRIGSLLEIVDQTGKRITSTRVNQLSFPLNVSFLPRGLYFIMVSDGRQKSMTKLVKI